MLMRKSMHALLALTMVSALALTGCGGAKESTGPAEPAPAAAPSSNAQDPIKAGVSKMLHALDGTEAAVEAKDAAKAQQEAKEADEAWEKFEDGVRAQSKDLYIKIEDQLHLITAGVKASSVDQKVVGEAIDKLRDLLNELAAAKPQQGSAKPAEADLKAGVATILHDLEGTKKALDAKDTAKAQAEVAESDEAWEEIEDQIKAKSADLYKDIEDNLHALEAAVKANPVDAKVAGEAITKLQKYLDRVPALVGDIPSGVAWMKHEAEGAKKAIEAKDAEKALKEVNEAAEAWDPIEDAVKAKSKDLYHKIEDELRTLKAAVKAQPVDTKVVNETADKLITLLDEAVK